MKKWNEADLLRVHKVLEELKTIVVDADARSGLDLYLIAPEDITKIQTQIEIVIGRCRIYQAEKGQPGKEAEDNS